MPIAFLTAHYALNPPGPPDGGRAGADPRGRGRRRAGRDPDRPAGRRRGLRHRRRPESASSLRRWASSTSWIRARWPLPTRSWSAPAGEGVDVVLNSLAGEAIPKSLGCCARVGRFLEIGKRDIWTRTACSACAVPQQPVVLRHRPRPVCREAAASWCGRCSRLMATSRPGDLEPLPLTRSRSSDAAAAFRYMAQAKHIGKVVITLADRDRRRRTAAAVRPDAHLPDHGRAGRPRACRSRAGCRARAPAPGADRAAERSPSGEALDARRCEARGAGGRRARRRGRSRDVARVLDDPPAAAAAAGRGPRGRRPRRRRAARSRPEALRPRAGAESAGRLEPARADPGPAARLLRAVLVGGVGVRLARPGQLRRGQRVPRRPGPAPPRARPAGAEHQLGPLGRGRHGRGDGRAGPHALGRQGVDRLSPEQASWTRSLRAAATAARRSPSCRSTGLVYTAFFAGQRAPPLLRTCCAERSPGRRASGRPAQPSVLAQVDGALRGTERARPCAGARPRAGRCRCSVCEPRHRSIGPQQGLTISALDSLMAVELAQPACSGALGTPLPRRCASTTRRSRRSPVHIAEPCSSPERTEQPRVAAAACRRDAASTSGADRDHRPGLPVSRAGRREAVLGAAARRRRRHRRGAGAIAGMSRRYYDPDPDAPGKMYTRWAAS